MAVTIYKYRVWCDTDSKWEYVWKESEPTKCPTNISHTIDVTKIIVIDKIEENLTTIREENIPTGGHYQACFNKINIPSGIGSTSCDVSFPHPISLLAAEWTNSINMAGDEIKFVVSPETIVGTIASGITSGSTIISVVQSVIDNVDIGYCIELYSDSGINELGRCINKDYGNNTITVETATTQSFSHTWPTYVRMHADMVKRSPLAGFGRIQLGEAKIGGSHIPANTILRATYWNNDGAVKNLIFVLEYLY